MSCILQVKKYNSGGISREKYDFPGRWLPSGAWLKLAAYAGGKSTGLHERILDQSPFAPAGPARLVKVLGGGSVSVLAVGLGGGFGSPDARCWSGRSRHMSTLGSSNSRRIWTVFRHKTTRTTTRVSDRPTWCRHYDEWKRAHDEAEVLTARNSDLPEDWSRKDLARLEALTQNYGEAADRMWDEAPETENWTSAHIKCR